ncbi:hypothetical protein AFLA_009381 [Aspergillus flavus NRRL3357]|nr:hypothetical protein AFLA_009381 [Aspergillus flavus NRRL3357]
MKTQVNNSWVLDFISPYVFSRDVDSIIDRGCRVGLGFEAEALAAIVALRFLTWGVSALLSNRLQGCSMDN